MSGTHSAQRSNDVTPLPKSWTRVLRWPGPGYRRTPLWKPFMDSTKDKGPDRGPPREGRNCGPNRWPSGSLCGGAGLDNTPAVGVPPPKKSRIRVGEERVGQGRVLDGLHGGRSGGGPGGVGDVEEVGAGLGGALGPGPPVGRGGSEGGGTWSHGSQPHQGGEGSPKRSSDPWRKEPGLRDGPRLVSQDGAPRQAHATQAGYHPPPCGMEMVQGGRGMFRGGSSLCVCAFRNQREGRRSEIVQLGGFRVSA